jgi:hypothetical protein
MSHIELERDMQQENPELARAEADIQRAMQEESREAIAQLAEARKQARLQKDSDDDEDWDEDWDDGDVEVHYVQ